MALAVPLAGATLSHEPDAVRATAVKFARPLPSFETFKVCEAAADPCPNANDSASGLAPSFADDPGSTVTLTAMVRLGGFATGDDTVIAPLYVPAGRPSGSTRICVVAGTVPESGV